MGALSNVTWSITSDQVYNNFNADEQKSVRYVIPLLVRQIRVMIYTGNMDLNCNVAGVDAYIREMQWPDWGKYYDAPRTQWNAGGTLVGYAKRYESFMTVGS
jgi:carboxypeptidase C (cathepsin A)